MQITRLEIAGFKSFGGRKAFDFKPGITAIVGPNGSGKSNVADAIRWVLGEQKSKRLRVGKSEDVVFHGTEKKPRPHRIPARHACAERRSLAGACHGCAGFRHFALDVGRQLPDCA